GVERGLVYVDDGVTESEVESFEALLHEGGARRIVREVDPREQMSAIARVTEDRLGPTLGPEPSSHHPGAIKRGGVLSFCRGDARRALGVEVDQEPTPPEHVPVAGR